MGIAMYRKIQKKYEYSDGVHGLMQDLHFHEGGVLTMPKHWGEKFKEGDEVIITLSTKVPTFADSEHAVSQRTGEEKSHV